MDDRKKLADLTPADVDGLPPGDPVAVKVYGCICDPAANFDGVGADAAAPLFDGRLRYVTDENCPLHGRRARAARLGIRLPPRGTAPLDQEAPKDGRSSLFRFPRR